MLAHPYTWVCICVFRHYVWSDIIIFIVIFILLSCEIGPHIYWVPLDPLRILSLFYTRSWINSWTSLRSLSFSTFRRIRYSPRISFRPSTISRPSTPPSTLSNHQWPLVRPQIHDKVVLPHVFWLPLRTNYLWYDIY